MKKNYTCLLLLTVFSLVTVVSFGQDESNLDEAYVILNFGGNNVYYDLNFDTGNTNFNGLDLSSFTSSQQLFLNGAENKVHKCGNHNILNGWLNYRVYSTTNLTPPAFNTTEILFGTNLNTSNYCNGTSTDQRWESFGANIDILSGLPSGDYYLEVYTHADVDYDSDNILNTTVYANAGGANYKAFFRLDNPPVANCQSITVQLNASGNASIVASDIDNGSSDDLDTPPALSIDISNFTCSDVGTPVTVTLTATDSIGQTDSCTATVTVEDNMAPTAICQAVTVQLDAAGNASVTPAQVNNGSTDNCGTVNLVSVSPSTFTCANLGDNTVTLTINDGNGNQSTCTAIVTVQPYTTNATVTYTKNPNVNTVCDFETIDFTAVPSGLGGDSASYEWFVNNVSEGTGINFSYDSWTAPSDVIKVVMTVGSGSCAPIKEYETTISVNDERPVSFSIAGPASICEGANATFNITNANNLGANPTYQWKLNGVSVGTNSSSYTANGLTVVGPNVVTLEVTSNALCATPAGPISSNNIAVTVNPNSTISDPANKSQTLCIGATLASNNGNIVFSIGGGATNASVSGLPPGVSGSYSSGSFTIVGTPTSSGTFNYTVTTSGGGCSQVSQTGVLTVNPNATISINPADSNTQTVCSGQSIAPIRYTIGGSANAVEVTGLPAGISGSLSSGVFTISGSATVATSTTYNYTVKATGPCGPASLNGTITIHPNVTPSISITATNTTICAGDSVTFNVGSQTNGGTNPTYQWQINNTNVSGATNNFFTTSTLTNGNTVRVIMTSNATCTTSTTATSNAIGITVNPNLTPSVSIVSNDADNTICPGTSVLFTATPVNGGNAPLYQWKINGNNVGGNTTDNTFSTTALTNGQTVTVVMTSNETCLASNNVTSNGISTTVQPTLTPSVTIVSSDADNNVCQGASVTFTATPTNGGSSPSYQWYIGATPAGTNSATFITSALPTGAVVSVVMTTNYPCSTSATATSNSFSHTRYTPLTAPVISGPTGVCPTTTQTYSVPANTNVLNYIWNVPAGWIINSGQGTNSIVVSFTTPALGANNISVQTSNPCNAVSSANYPVTIQNFAAVNAGPDQYICTNTSSIQLNMTIGGAVNRRDEFTITSDSGGTLPPTNGNVNLVDVELQGTYTLPANPPSVITLTIATTENVSGCNGVRTDTMQIFIQPNPTATISGTTSVCTGTGTNITFTGTPNTTVTYKINGGANQTVNIGASGSAIVATGNLTANATYSLVNVGYTNPSACSQNLSAPPAVVTVTPNATIGNPTNKNQTICINTSLATNNGNISFALGGGATNASVTGLPTGMSGNLSGSNYIISGTPTQTGNFNYTVTTTGTCIQAQQTGTIVVNPDATITDPANENQSLCVNTNISNIVFTVGGGATGATVTGLPAGVTSNYNASGKTLTISGIPTASGSFPYTVTTTGTCLQATHSGTLTVNPNGAITTPTNLNQTICIDTAITDIVFTISGGATIASASNLPPGLSLVDTGNSTYTISGTATTSGIYNYTVSTTGTCVQTSKNGTITVTGDSKISEPANKNQTVCINTAIGNISFDLEGTATGASVIGLPAGVSGNLSGSSFLISGTPTVPGTFNYMVTTTGPCGNVSESGQLIINLNDSITNSGNVDQTVCLGDSIVNITFTIGGGATNATVSGLPSGLSANLTGNNFVISGQPSQFGVFNYSVTTSGVCAPTVSNGILTIKNPVSIGTQPSNIGVCVSDSASISVGASGDNLTYQWYKGTPGSGTIVNNNPPQILGATSNTLTFANTSSANAGNYYVVVSGHAVCGNTTSADAQLTVNQDISITQQPASITNCVGNSITFTVVATGTIGSYQWKKGGVDFNGGIANSATSGTTTTFTLQLQNIATGDAGNYSLQLISNGGTCPEANTSVASLTVTQLPTANISYATPFCTNNATAQPVTLTGTNAYTGGSYSYSVVSGGPTLSLNTSNGSITPNTSSAGTYTVTYTIPASGGCPADNTVITSVTIAPLPIASISYSGTAFCESDTNTYNVSLSGSNNGGGTYSISPSTGLTMNSSGQISPNGATPGNYTISYTVPSSTGCPSVVATAAVQIQAQPNATFSYAAANYCSNGSNPTPTVTQSGGLFTASPAGLSINASTGVINLSTSTPASYTVYYTFAAVSGGCAQVQVSRTINITPLPVATIAYSAAAYCKSDTNPYTVTLSGSNNSGGAYSSSPAGLTISSAGTITPNTSTVGTYTVSYTIPAAGGCSVVIATASVRIDALPVATFTYNAAQYCKTGANPILSFTGGGVAGNFTYTSNPVGLTLGLNASTGAINLAGSTAGTYTITNTIPASAGCVQVQSSQTITINASTVGGTVTGFVSTDPTTISNNIIACHSGSGTLTLSGYTGTIVKWQSSTNGGVTWTDIANTTNTLNFNNITVTTLFRAVLQSGNCGSQNSAIAIVNVIPPNIKPTVSPSAVQTICLGGSVNYTSTSGFGTGQQLLEDGGDFNNANPAGWLVDGCGNCLNAGGNNTDPGPWKETNGPKTFAGTTYDTSDNTKFAIVSGNFNSIMQTPVFNTLGLTTATLTFYQAYVLTVGAQAIIELSTNGGATYNITLQTITGAANSGNHVGLNYTSIDLQNYIGQTNLKIRFRYIGTTNSSWAVDDIALPAAPANEAIEWIDINGNVLSTNTTFGYTPVTPGVNIVGVTSLINGCRSTIPDGVTYVTVRANFAYAGQNIAPVAGECGVSTVTLNAYDNTLTAAQNIANGAYNNNYTTGTISGTGAGGTWTIDSAPATCTGTPTFSSTTNPRATFSGPAGVYTLRWSVAGCSSTVQVTLQDCQTVDFDGVDDYATFGNTFNRTGNFSIEAWVKPNSITGNQTILSKRNGAVNGNGYDLRLTGSTLSFNWNGTGTISSPFALTTNRWYHVAVTFDSASPGTYRMFIDGIQVATANGSTPATNTFQFLIGAVDQTGNPPNKPVRHFNGWIDEVRLWNKTITVEQVRQMMNQQIINNGAAVRGEVVPLDVAGLNWTDLDGYYRMEIGCGSLVPYAGTVAGKLRNITTAQPNSAPLPYTTKAIGNWDTTGTGTPWTFGDSVWDHPNSTGYNNTPIDWNIARTSHNVTSDARDITLLGLLVDSNELSITSPGTQDESNVGTGLRITHYLKLDGTIDLVGESQLIQDEGSILDVTSSGKLERDQQGTTNYWNYNYWSSPVSPINVTANNTNYSIGGVLKDGTISSAPTNFQWTTGHNANASTSPRTMSSRWLYSYQDFAQNSYSDWVDLDQNSSLKVGLGFTMKGSGAGTAVQNYVFVGKPNNGTITNTVSPNYQTLIGNPYPSAIDANEFIRDNIPGTQGNTGSSLSIDGSLYFWEHYTSNVTHILELYEGSYAVRNLSGGLAAVIPDGISGAGASTKIPGQFIPVGQSFFVTASPSGGNISFHNDQRAFVREAAGSSVFMRQANQNVEADQNTDTNDLQRLRLQFSSNGLERPLLLAFTPDNAATAGFDYGYDALFTDQFPNDMFWNIDGENYIIQGVGQFEDTNMYPLNMNITNAGTIAISLTDLENFDDAIDVYIHDTLLNTYHQINTTDFTMTLDAGNYDNRFFLTFVDGETLTIDENEVSNVMVNYLLDTDEIYIKPSPGVQVKQIYLINVIGQTVKSWNMTNMPMTDEIRITTNNVSEGTYIIKVETDGATINKKVIIKY